METKASNQKFYKWKVSKAFSGKSLLFFLEQKLLTVPSKRALKRAIEKNLCFINTKRESFSSKKVFFQDEIKLDTKWEEHLAERQEQLTILFEDDDVCVIDKPSNMVCEESFFKKRGLFLCHRLDKQTTGILLLTKNKKARELLFKQFEERTIEKEYLALADKEVKSSNGIIKNVLVKKNSYQGQTIYGASNSATLAAGGKSAITNWICLDKNSQASFLLLKPKTGRTHQLRVHLSEMGHPILGDFQYSRNFSHTQFIPRILLHSYKISFIHPTTNEPISLTSAIPKDMQESAKKFHLCLNIS